MPTLTFLIVDDNELQRRLADACLGEVGHHPLFASNSHEADDILATTAVNVVVVSAALPEGEAQAALTAALRQRRVPGSDTSIAPPVVVVATDDNHSPLATQLLARGATGLIRRPYAVDRLAPQLELFSVGSAPATILVIDDSETTRRTSAAILSNAGHDVLEGSDGERGLELLRTHPGIDLVLTDLVMPKIDGYDVIRAIRTRESTRNLPVLLLTALDDIASQSRAIEVGCDDVLSKPITATELQMRVRAMLRLKTLQRRLANRNAELERAIRMREHLTHLLVHDFKNPLTRVTVSAEMIAEQCDNAQLTEASELAQDVLAGALRLQGLTDDLLQVARIQDGVAKPALTRFPLQPLIQEVVADLHRVAETNEVTVAIGNKVEVDLHADRAWIYRVIQNLVDNAIKYSPAGDEVELDTFQVSSDARPRAVVRLVVADRGHGIPPEYRDIIFEKFAQVPRTARRGSGLGLAFCRLATEAHGGSVQAKPRADGEHGASFVLTLPLA